MSIFNDFELLDFINPDEMLWGMDAPAYSLVASAGEVSVSGPAVTFTKQSILSPSSGVVSFSGQAVILRADHKIDALAGDFSATGSTADLIHRLPANPGSVLVEGAAAGLCKTHNLTAGSGAISVTGKLATVGRILTLSAEAAATVAVVGTPSKTLYGRTVLSDGASYDVEGVAALLRATRKMAAAGKNLAISGSAVALKTIRTLIAASGGLSLTGQSAGKIRSFRLSGAPGTAQVSGCAVSFAANGRLETIHGEVSVTGHSAKLGLYYFRFMPSAPGAYETATYAALLRHAHRLVASAVTVQVNGAETDGVYHEIPSFHPACVSPVGGQDLHVISVAGSALRVSRACARPLNVTRVSGTGLRVVRL